MAWSVGKTARRCVVIIPARDEAPALAQLLPDIPSWIDHVIVANNGSTDDTAEIAADMGAIVVDVPEAGYGRACLAGIAIAETLSADIIIFMDGDRSDVPEQMTRLVEPIAEDRLDMVIGSRILGHCEPGALTPQQYFGNRLACGLMQLYWSHHYSDLGPFRAIRADALAFLKMREQTFGWTVEMQLRALQCGLRVGEAPVDYRQRIGQSKISGTVRGVVLAGYHILKTIMVAAWRDRKRDNTFIADGASEESKAIAEPVK
ncbi:MAG: glycosyltransferase family 2 protein [Pseudomonadota bacterium]